MTQARLQSTQEIEAILPAWNKLARRSLAPAGLNSPEIIAPLLKHVGGAELLVVLQDDELLFALPVQKRKFPRGLLGNWVTPLTPNGTPHVCSAAPASALAALLSAQAVPMLLTAVETNGKFWDYITTREAHVEIVDRWERAALRPRGNFASWMDTNFNAKRRKEYRRLLARLGEQGKLEQQTLAAGESPEEWISALLDLEAAGWKGQRGTALASDAGLTLATREALSGLADAGKLRMWRITLDGKTIAIMHGVAEADRVWLGKIAYDERLSKFSPGVLLILYATEMLFAEEGVALVDSCAIPDHPMINHIWRDRLEVADVMIAPKSISAAHFRFMVQLERLRRMTRAMARDTYNYFRGRHRS